MKNEEKIVRLVYCSRFSLICLQYFANLVIPDHDAQVFTYPVAENRASFDKVIDHLLGGFLRWDAQYFMHIAKHGYTYENTLAFFPVYPLSTRFLGEFIADIFRLQIYIDSILLVTFVILNVYIFKQSALTLYKLTSILFNKKIAFDSVVLFCFNPASIFFIAPYTECLFSYLTFSTILNCLQIYDKYSKPDCKFSSKDLLLILPIQLSTATRSNGILNIGFLIYTFICLYKKHVKQTMSLQWYHLLKILHYVFAVCITTIDCLLPFIFYQYYCFTNFCEDFAPLLSKVVVEHAKRHHYVLPGSFSKHNQKWCKSLVPLAYSYVQDHYWDVGFMRYYQWKQLPNFFLAFPILFTILYFCIKHLYVNMLARKYRTIFLMENPVKIGKTKVQITKTDLYQPKLTVFYVHALFLSLFCTFFIHIQVSTRLLCSATPVFYWVCAKHLTLFQIHSKSDKAKFEWILRVYFVSYFVIGTIMFCNFLPWT